MMRTVLVGVALVLAAACTDREAGEAAPTEPVATLTPSTSPSASPAPAASTGAVDSESPGSGARSVTEETDDFAFDYSYPAQAGNIPELAALLDRSLERARALLAQQAARGRAEARENGFPYNKYSSGMEWQLVAELPGWLSLSGEQTEYTGGAHGNFGVRSLVWNKPAGEAMNAVALFASTAMLEEALGDRYCEALDRERTERGTPPVAVADGAFAACPGIAELTVLVGSSNGRTFDRLTLYAGPYVAGSYAEGAYAVDLEVDEAVLAAVKPQFQAAFSAR